VEKIHIILSYPISAIHKWVDWTSKVGSSSGIPWRKYPGTTIGLTNEFSLTKNLTKLLEDNWAKFLKLDSNQTGDN